MKKPKSRSRSFAEWRWRTTRELLRWKSNLTRIFTQFTSKFYKKGRHHMLDDKTLEAIRTWASNKSDDPDHAKLAKQAAKFAVLLALHINDRLDKIETDLAKKKST